MQQYKTMRNSQKRDAILDVIRSTTIHPSAEWVYEQLKPVYPDLSLGTVYRNISVFRELGEIISVGHVNGQERFDGNTLPHTHFVCACCGRVLDVDTPESLDAAMDETIDALEHKTGAYSLTLYGTCADCLTTA